MFWLKQTSINAGLHKVFYLFQVDLIASSSHTESTRVHTPGQTANPENYISPPPRRSPSLLQLQTNWWWKAEKMWKKGRENIARRSSSKMPPAAEAASPNGYWGIPTATIDWCEENYEVRSRNYIFLSFSTLYVFSTTSISSEVRVIQDPIYENLEMSILCGYLLALLAALILRFKILINTCGLVLFRHYRFRTKMFQGKTKERVRGWQPSRESWLCISSVPTFEGSLMLKHDTSALPVTRNAMADLAVFLNWFFFRLSWHSKRLDWARLFELWLLTFFGLHI